MIVGSVLRYLFLKPWSGPGLATAPDAGVRQRNAASPHQSPTPRLEVARLALLFGQKGQWQRAADN